MRSRNGHLHLEAARVLENLRTLCRNHGEEFDDTDLERALHAAESALERLVTGGEGIDEGKVAPGTRSAR